MDFYSDSEDYDDGAEEIVEDGSGDATEEELLDFAALVSNTRRKPYKILKEVEIRQLQESYISDVCNVLSVSKNVACTLLCQNNWTPSSVYDKWFGGQVDNKQPVIVQPPKTKKKPPKKDRCKICYDTTRIRKIVLRDTVSAACGHLFCVDCYKTYISTSVENGPGCLTLKCPEPGCEYHPGPDMVDSIASPDDKDKYYRFLYRSYVESGPNRKWCPAPGCDFAIEFDWVEGESYDVACDCGSKMCWNCSEEGHSPSGCETVAKWAEKQNSEAESTTWVTAYTKPCPKCRRSIEKNQGCNHMTCGDPCKYNFCWTCLGRWKGHGYGQCNGYKEDKESQSRSRRDRENAKEKMERYAHYYKRWDSNDKSRKRALDDLNAARNEHVGRLAETQMKESSSTDELMFVVEAWEQVVECRRVLKWSYVYGYYLSVSGSGKLKLFEHLQGEAEFALERLHHCAEKEMDKYLCADGPCDDFDDFRKKLAGLTSVTKNYFENLVRALENNLCEVEIADRKEPKRPWRI